jgi:hypothetical protein
LGIVIPIRKATQKMMTLGSGWAVPALVLICLLSAIPPVFYFALYRNQGTLRFSKRLRVLALSTALVFGIYVAVELLRKLDWREDPGTVNHLATLLGEFSNVAEILILVALFRQENDDSQPDIPVSRLLRVVTKTTVITWGVWVAFNLVRFILTPYAYFLLRDLALQNGRMPLPFGRVSAETGPALLTQACLLTAPYIIYKREPSPNPL